MKFNKHPLLEGSHALLSASKHTWVNYDEERLEDMFDKWQATQKGTELHDLAAKLIKLGVKLPKTQKTLNMYVNDGIGFRMTPEVCLFYSTNAFGHADTISFRNNLLRIHDYKSGLTPVSMNQLEIYEALFCLEYGHNPHDIDTELRIYQSNEIYVSNPEPEKILYIMDKIIVFDKRINEIKD